MDVTENQQNPVICESTAGEVFLVDIMIFHRPKQYLTQGSLSDDGIVESADLQKNN